jgi:hypothetical protein
MFGLAALAALMAMAFVGASSAMAELATLCTGDGTGCGAVHVHETSVGKGKLLTGSLTVECDVLFLGDALSGYQQGSIISGNFTYTNCGSCSATEENGPSKIAILKTGHETTTVTGEGLVHVECSGINCRYIGEGLAGTGKGPLLSTQANGEVSISEATTEKESGLFCPSTSKLDLTTTPLSATYIASGGLHYCVEYEHNTNGRYTDAKCTKTGTGAYDLVIGPAGGVVGQMVCVHMNVTKTGLWEKIKNDTECETDNKLNLSVSLYELGKIVLVQ